VTEEKKFEFDLNRLTYDEFMELFGNADIDPDNPDQSLIDESESRKLMAKILVNWPSEMEITPENIGKLGILDFKVLQEEFSTLMAEVFDDSKN
jgi:hypothetical protein